MPELIGQKRDLLPGGPFEGFVRNGYRVLLADPPWRYLVRSPKGMGKSPDRHYSTMTIQELCDMPVRDLAAKDCVLFMWVIDSHVMLAKQVVEAWGFKFKTVGFYWAKTNADGSFWMNTGHWTRANLEHAYECYFGETEQEVERCFLNTVGAPNRVGKGVRRLIVAPRREHSRKPDEIYTQIEALVDGPYLELFGRQERNGWSTHGNELDKFYDPAVFDCPVRGLI